MSQHANSMSDGMPGDLALMQAHLDSLAGQIAFLRMELEARTEEARRKDHIIMALTQRVPELEPVRDEGRGLRGYRDPGNLRNPGDSHSAPVLVA